MSALPILDAELVEEADAQHWRVAGPQANDTSGASPPADPATNGAPPTAERAGIDPEFATAFNATRAKPAALEFEDDFADVFAGDIAPPAQLVPGLVVENAVNWFAGHPKNGKTTIVLWAALEPMRQGQHVIWLDWENGKRRLAQRLRALGADEALLRKFFHYAYRPMIAANPLGFLAIAAAAMRWPGAFVAFDSAGKALSHAGLSEDSNPDTLRWTTNIVLPTRDTGATVAVIDHVVKGATRSTPYPRGAGTKLADTEVFWYVEAVETFRRDQPGRLRLTNHADRDGVLPDELRYSVGDGKGNLPIRRVEAADGRSADYTMEHVIAALSEHAPDEDHAVSANQLTRLAGGKRERVAAS